MTKVTAHFNSYEAGMVQFCQHFSSVKEAVDTFRTYINASDYYQANLDADDAVMDLYPYTPEDNDMMCHGDYPTARYSAGKIRNGRRAAVRETI